MHCPTCGCENDDKNTECEVCGTELVSNDDSKVIPNRDKNSIDKSKIIIISLITAIFVVIIITIAVVVNFNKGNENTYDHISHINPTDEVIENDYSDIIEAENKDKLDIEETVKHESATAKSNPQITRSEKEINREKALDCLKKANAALKNGEREGALQMADEAIKLCSDDDIKKKYDDIYKYAPFKLYDEDNALQIENFDHRAPSFSPSMSFTANNQKEMNNCILMFLDYTVEANPLSKVIYNFEGNYDTLSGTEFIRNAEKNIKQEGHFEIYGDGKKLYTSQTFMPSVLPKEFSINVSGIERLIIVFYGHTDHWDSMGGSGGYGISDLVALKNLP